MVDKIVFNTWDREGFYDKPVTLPAAAVWNMDEFLLSYIAAGLTWLLEEGNVDWEATGEMRGKPNLRDDLVRARDLAASYNFGTKQSESGNECFRLIADIGVGYLWD